VSSSGEKGSFSADIGQDVIDEALKSVERRERAEGGGAAPSPATPTTPAALPPAGAPAPAAPAADDELATLKAELELSTARGRDMMQKLKDEHERMLRASADLENFKKRAAKEKEEIQKFGLERLLKDLIPVYDNFDRALEHARDASDFDSLRQGVEMIRRLFEDTLGRHGVKTFSAKGEAFDPNKHEAMKAEETDAVPPNRVLAEVLRGFTLNDRLVRPALVIVSKGKEPEAPAQPTVAPGAGGPAGSGSN
jgi:molecular chaperone GrpE